MVMVSTPNTRESVLGCFLGNFGGTNLPCDSGGSRKVSVAVCRAPNPKGIRMEMRKTPASSFIPPPDVTLNKCDVSGRLFVGGEGKLRDPDTNTLGEP